MPLGDGYEVGAVYTRLGYQLSDQEKVALYNREVDKVKAKVAERDKFKAQLGADFDPRAFRAYERELRQVEHQNDRVAVSNRRVAVSLDGVADRASKADLSTAALSGTMRGLFDTAGRITVIGILAQGLSALGAAGGAAVAGLAPAAGALAAVPAVATAAGQGLGTVRLATVGLGEASEKLAERLAKPTPAAKRLVESLEPLVPRVRAIQRETASGFLSGVEKGSESATRNLGILERAAPRTARVLGGLAEQAGRLVGSKAFGRDLETQLGRNDTTIRRLGESGLNLADAFRHVTIEAGPLVHWLTASSVRLSELIERKTEAARESGELADGLDETREALSRVARISGDVAAGLFNIGKAGKPLGEEVLRDLVRASDEFREWTESAEGQNAIRDYFNDAAPAIDELGSLIEATVKMLLRLGRGDQVAPLLRSIRQEILPAVEELVDKTTESFGPVFIDFLTQAILLFSKLAGDSGPLHAFTSLLADALRLLNTLIDRFPLIGTALVTIAAAGGIAKALNLAAAISGVKSLIGLLGKAAGLSAGVGAAGGIAGGAAGGAAAGGGSRILDLFKGRGDSPAKPLFVLDVGGGLPGGGRGPGGPAPVPTGGGRPTGPLARAGNVLRGAGRFATRGVGPAGIGLAAYTGLLSTVPDLDELTERLDQLIEGPRDSPRAKRMRELALALEDAKKSGNAQQLRKVSEEIDRLAKGASDPNIGQGLRDLGKDVRAVANAREWGELGDVVKQTKRQFRVLALDGKADMEDIRFHVAVNTKRIKERLGKDTDAGRAALADNFQRATRAVRRQMRAGEVATRDGMKAIRGYLQEELQLYGFTIRQARIASRGRGADGQLNFDPDDVGRRQFQQGGWIGARGMRSGDVVKVAPNAYAAYGEYHARGPGRRAAVINRHQAPVVELALMRGGYTLDTLPRDHRALPIIEGAMADWGGLNALFATVNRPHMYQQGGIVPIPGEPGESIHSSILGQVLGLIRRWRLDITDGYATSGHAPGGEHPLGLAIDAVPGPGGSWDLIDQLNAWAQGQLGRIFRWIGYDGVKGHGRGHHIHLSWLPGGGTGGPGIGDIARRVVTGGGAVGRAVQGALDLARGSGNSLLANAFPTGPVIGHPGSVVGGAGAYSKQQLAKLWIRAGGDPAQANLMAAIALAESGGRPSIVNSIGAGGLWQIHPPEPNYLNPLTNAQIAVRKLASQGLGAWEAYTKGMHTQYLQGGGFLDEAYANDPGWHPDNSTTGKPLAIRILRRKQGKRVTAYDTVIDQIANAARGYEQTDRRYNQTDEDFVNDDGSLNQEAINRRAGELTKLTKIRQRILRLNQKAEAIARRVVTTYRTMIERLERSLKHAKRKDRKGIRNQIGTYRDELGQWRETLTDAGFDITDARLDLGDLAKEKAEVTGTQPETPDTGDPGDGGGSDPDLEAQLAQAEEVARVATEKLRISEANLRVLDTPGGRNPMAIGAAQTPAAAAGGAVYAGAPVDRVALGGGGGGGVTVIQEINTLHPADSRTYDAIGRAATVGQAAQGSVQSPRVDLGV